MKKLLLGLGAATAAIVAPVVSVVACSLPGQKTTTLNFDVSKVKADNKSKEDSWKEFLPKFKKLLVENEHGMTMDASGKVKYVTNSHLVNEYTVKLKGSSKEDKFIRNKGTSIKTITDGSWDDIKRAFMMTLSTANGWTN